MIIMFNMYSANKILSEVLGTCSMIAVWVNEKPKAKMHAAETRSADLGGRAKVIRQVIIKIRHGAIRA